MADELHKRLDDLKNNGNMTFMDLLQLVCDADALLEKECPGINDKMLEDSKDPKFKSLLLAQKQGGAQGLFEQLSKNAEPEVRKQVQEAQVTKDFQEHIDSVATKYHKDLDDLELRIEKELGDRCPPMLHIHMREAREHVNELQKMHVSRTLDIMCKRQNFETLNDTLIRMLNESITEMADTMKTIAETSEMAESAETTETEH